MKKTKTIKERPILFSAPMVNAILEGTKTQTRRPLRIQPSDIFERNSGKVGIFKPPYLECPHGKHGDRLWVRETWAPAYGSGSHEYPLEGWSYFEWDKELHGPIEKGADNLCIFYRADGEDELPAEFSMPGGSEIRWKPSIFMPRWASRITLDITGVRVERLQDISRDDAMSEGIPQTYGEAVSLFGENPLKDRANHIWDNATTVQNLKWLWDSINAKKHPWSSNPWVWVIEFKNAGEQVGTL